MLSDIQRVIDRFPNKSSVCQINSENVGIVSGYGRDDNTGDPRVLVKWLNTGVTVKVQPGYLTIVDLKSVNDYLED